MLDNIDRGNQRWDISCSFWKLNNLKISANSKKAVLIIQIFKQILSIGRVLWPANADIFPTVLSHFAGFGELCIMYCNQGPVAMVTICKMSYSCRFTGLYVNCTKALKSYDGYACARSGYDDTNSVSKWTLLQWL